MVTMAETDQREKRLRSLLFLEALELFEKHGFVLPDDEQQSNIAIVRVHEHLQAALSHLQDNMLLELRKENNEQG
jgi:hypothetical protein